MSLDVYLHEERIGTLFPAGEGDFRFAYDPAVVARVGSGAQLLSIALPAREEPFSNEATRAYVDGLLPDGRLRLQAARRLGVEAGDAHGLLALLGGDCVGAVSFLPAGSPGRAEEDRWLGSEELEDLVAGPGRAFAGGGEALARFALPGIHHKLALVRDESRGRWGAPAPQRPSTHIVKPETGEFPELIANEMFCMAVARAIGLPVPHAEVAMVGGRSCLVVERFDRVRAGSRVRRLHQEDFCQALSFPPTAGASPFGLGRPRGTAEHAAEGPGFAEASGLLRAVQRSRDLPLLLGVAFLNYTVGNGDAHGKNFALLYDGEGARLAPFYDIASTAVYDAPIHAGMVLGADYDEYAYLLELARTSEECDVEFDYLRSVASVAAEKIGEELERVAERSRNEGWHAPIVDQIVEFAAERALGLGAEVAY